METEVSNPLLPGIFNEHSELVYKFNQTDTKFL